jgi:Fe-S cluster assembly ATP-binding protein
MNNILEIKNLSVSLGDKQLLTDINMSVEIGARHLISGHNGSGKSTLVRAISGDNELTVDAFHLDFDGRDIKSENATTRALMGIFLGAQNVPEIPGLTLISFLKHSAIAHSHFNTGKELSMAEFLEKLELARTRLNIPRDWLNRSANVGFSGGERKKIMLLRLLMTRPKLAILDEPDSGADAATQLLIADIIHKMTDTTFIFISHQEKFTNMINPTATTTLSAGRIMV